MFGKLLFYVKDQFDKNQHGFIKQRSCETAVAAFTQDIYNDLDEIGGKAIAVFIDFSKAFDSVNHKLLIKKLMMNFTFKIPPYFIRLLISYFTDRSFRIINNDYKSEYYSIKSGTPAGSQIGPLLYSLFINDIGDVIDLPYKFYADDSVIYVGCKSFDDGRNKIQLCLNRVNEWCEQNGLKINVSKTKFMLFFKSKDFRSKKASELPITIKLNNEAIERVNSFKYLGVHIDCNLSFKIHFDQVESNTCNALSRFYRLRRQLTPNVIKIFLSAYVSSIIDYCIVVWAVQTDNQLDSLQNRINRFLFVYFYNRKNSKKCNMLSMKDVYVLLEKVD